MEPGPERSRAQRVSDALVKGGLPLAVLAIVMAVFFGEQMGIDHEVQLVVPATVDPGGALPVRALVFANVTEPYAELADAPVDLTLRGPSGATVLTARLDRSPAGGTEGILTVPGDARGPHRLQAIARGPEGSALASAEATVTIQPSPELAPVHGRLAGALQRLSLGPVTPVEGATAPDVLDARVAGAACVPEAPCDLLVHVGAPAASVRVVASASTEPTSEASAVTEGLARLTVVVHGPEASAELEALRDGAPVARRAIQIPTALATPGLTLSTRLVAPGEEVSLAVSGLEDRPGVIVDAYRDGRWRATGSYAWSTEPVPLPMALEAGVWTLEVRTDPFSAERAAVRRLVVGSAPDEVTRAPAGDATDRIAWVSADHEVRVHRLPEPVRGLPQDLAKLRERQALLRTAALAAIVLGLVVLLTVFLRRGMDAALEAQRVMDATGDPELTSARHRRRTLLSALAIVATVALAFVGAAALVIARARLLE